jgi:hypothetical protein
MAKNTNSGKFKQDQVLSQFTKDIRQGERRTWLTAVERAILQGQRNAEYRQRLQDINAKSNKSK